MTTENKQIEATKTQRFPADQVNLSNPGAPVQRPEKATAPVSPDYTFDFGDPISFGDMEVSEPVDPSVLAKMPYTFDVTENDTALRHKIYSPEPITRLKRSRIMMIELKARSVMVHTGSDHAPIWLEPGIYPVSTIREQDVWENKATYVFD